MSLFMNYLFLNLDLFYRNFGLFSPLMFRSSLCIRDRL